MAITAELNFPRGGKQKEANELSDSKASSSFRGKRKSETSVKTDFLFGKSKDESATSPRFKKQKKTSSTSNLAKSLLPLGGGGVVQTQHARKSKSGKDGSSTKVVPIIEALGFSKLSKGTKVLGCVREIQDDFAVLALPNMLSGYILRDTKSAFSAPLTQTLSLGQVLTVVVQKVVTETLSGGQVKKRIQLSALPSHVNPRSNNSNNSHSDTSIPLWRGQITSVEDHGCLVDLGLGRKGFLKFDEIEGGNYTVLEDDEELSDDDSEGEDASMNRILQRGRLYDFSFSEHKGNGSVVALKLPLTATVAQHLVLPSTSSSSPHTLSTLQPGMMVTAKIEALAKNGLCVTFLGNVFRGAIELGIHMGGTFLPRNSSGSKLISLAGNNAGNSVEDAWKKVFDNHQHFPARIVAIDVPTKLIRLSIAPHVLLLQPARPVKSQTRGIPSIGTIVNDCTVVRVDQGIGALLALPDSFHSNPDAESSILPKRLSNKSDLFQSESFQHAMGVPTAYVHISKAIQDEEGGKKKGSQKGRREAQVGQFAKDFSLGSKHSVRILSTGHWIDGVASGGCSPSILQAHVLTHSDLKAGQVYKQVPVVAQLAGGSVLVNLGGSPGNPVRGLIASPIHLTDQPSSTSASSSDFRKRVLETKFAVDAKVDVRVLWVDHIKKKCALTAKKSIVKVKDESQIVSSYEDLQLNQTVVGFVSKVEERALYVTFCNRVYGKVTAKSLASELGVERIEDAYQVGDVVQARVVKITQSTSRGRRLSNLDNDEDDEVDMEVSDDEKETRAYYQVLLSLKVSDNEVGMEEAPDDTDVSGPKQVVIKAGAILPEKSMKIVELVKGKPRKKGKGFVPGFAIVNIKSKYLLEDPNMLPHVECKLPFDQLLDDYAPGDISSVDALDAKAGRLLRAGKKINQKAIVLTDPQKSSIEHSSGVGRLTVVSLRPALIETMEKQRKGKLGQKDVQIPTPKTDLFVGALVQGYVAQVDSRHGAFLRFLDGMTGLIPRVNGGLNLTPYSTLKAKVQVIDDTVKPSKIMLQPVGAKTRSSIESSYSGDENMPFSAGDTIGKVAVDDIQSQQLRLNLLDGEVSEDVRVILHISMKDAAYTKVKARKKPVHAKEPLKNRAHPFYGIKSGDILDNVKVVASYRQRDTVIIQVTDRTDWTHEKGDSRVLNRSDVKPGKTVAATVSSVEGSNKGLQVHISPMLGGFIPGLELSKDLELLIDISSHIPIGARLKCVVMDQLQWHENRAKAPFASQSAMSWSDRKSTPESHRRLYLSVVAVDEPTLAMQKPARGETIIGRISRGLPVSHAPAMMISLRGGFVGRCCITELAEPDDWENMPLGRTNQPEDMSKQGHSSEDMEVDSDDESDGSESDADDDMQNDEFRDGSYVECRVLKAIPKQSVVDVSLRGSRIEGDMDDDEAPPEGETVQAFVVQTNKKGCFVRLARHIEGRVTLKELCDGFLPNPAASFPMGRLVVGKVKSLKQKGKSKNSKDPIRIQVDLDMRESTLLEHKKKLSFEDIEIEKKYKGTVTRVESYGVFVQIENSSVSGLVHMSECSDNFIKNLEALYNPGDLVKILVIKKDTESKKLGFSLKASHFEDDEDSDESDSEEQSEDESIVGMTRVFEDDKSAEDGLDSDDENFASNLAAQMEGEDSSDDSENSDDESHDDDSAEGQSDSVSEGSTPDRVPATDKGIGFDWTVGGVERARAEEQPSDESESDDDDDDSDEDAERSSHTKSKKKQAQRRREENEISRKETALADGTADENPETSGDFESLLAGNPNSSELWIRYMAFHLSLADVSSARVVAEKALNRIEFQEEREKLNVWAALLTLEHKYGTKESFQATIDRACGQNNPKHVYLRACEVLEKDSSSPEMISRADELFAKMCKKFKKKKQVWLSHLSYSLKQSRHQEAQALLKRSLLSLPTYKHAEVVSRFAQFEFEYGSAERARTLFDGLLLKHPKRLDLLFVYLDKEVKFGNVDSARATIKKTVADAKLSDKSMKNLFKKWYRIEEQCGDEETQEEVKDAARSFVQNSS